MVLYLFVRLRPLATPTNVILLQVEREVINLAGAKVQYSRDKLKNSGVSGCDHCVGVASQAR